MVHETSSSISYLFFAIIFGFIFIPFCIYSIIKFYGFRNDRRFKKRHGKLSTFTAINFVLELFSGCLLTLAFSRFLSRDITIILAWIGDILNFISYFLIIHSLVLRFWCLYYDIRYQLATKHNLWKSLIDEYYIINDQHLSQVKSFDIEDDLWFIKNKHRQGNSKWMARVWALRSFLSVLTILFLMIIIEIVFSVGLRRGVIEVIFTILFMIPFFFMIYIYHKIPPFNDPFFIRKEIVIIHNIDLVDVVSSAVVSIIANYGIYASINNTSGNPYSIILENDYLNILMMITFYVMGISHVIIIYIMTFWVRSKIIEDQKRHSTLFSKVSDDKNSYLILRDILEHQLGFEYFMQHLIHEFSAENLLSVTEFIQFKCLIKDKHENNLREKEIVLNLPMDHIPKSSIVYNVDNNIGMIVYKLWFKYIRNGSDQQINVSFENRNAFTAYIDSERQTICKDMLSLLSADEYFEMFDECIMEILRLMEFDSYPRFTNTDNYKKIKKLILTQTRKTSTDQRPHAPSNTTEVNMEILAKMENL